MAHQMARGSQVAFAKAWLERHNIESQTVDVYSHIDSSLSYEENIKNLKQMLGMGGRSTKKATRDLSAAECDVAIGNYNAGFDHESTREACDCGEPTACDDVMREKGTTAKPKPKKTPTPKAKPKAAFTVSGRPSIGKQTIPTKKEFYQTEYWHDPKAGRHPASGAGRLPMRHTAYLESASVGGDTMWKMHNPATGEDTYFDFADKEEAQKQFKNLYKKTFGTQKATAKPKVAAATPNPLVMLGAGTVQAVTKPKRRPAAKKPARKKRTAKTTKAKPKATPKRKVAKPKKTAAKPKPKAKKTASTVYKLTATQKKRLATNGRITVKRGGKFITITK